MNTNVQSNGFGIPAAADFQSPAKPPQITVWDEPGYTLLHTLTCRIPLLSESQAIHVLRQQVCSHSFAAARLDQLRAAGWLERFRCLTHWPSMPAAPRACWNPGESRPELARLRLAARRAIANDRPRNIGFYVASRFTANLFGMPYRGTVNIERISEWLAWAQVYLHLRTAGSHLAVRCNCREISSPNRAPRTMPSYLTIASKGAPAALIGLLAHSSVNGLLALHKHCQEHSIPYLLW